MMTCSCLFRTSFNVLVSSLCVLVWGGCLCVRACVCVCVCERERERERERVYFGFFTNTFLRQVGIVSLPPQPAICYDTTTVALLIVVSQSSCNGLETHFLVLTLHYSFVNCKMKISDLQLQTCNCLKSHFKLT
jgi:hypothetical protein